MPYCGSKASPRSPRSPQQDTMERMSRKSLRVPDRHFQIWPSCSTTYRVPFGSPLRGAVTRVSWSKPVATCTSRTAEAAPGSASEMASAARRSAVTPGRRTAAP